MLIASIPAGSAGAKSVDGAVTPAKPAALPVRTFGSVLAHQTGETASGPSQLATGKASAKQDPFVQLEAVFLRNFVEAMLPAEDAGSFGTGSAGEYWRSMLADEMAKAVAVNGKMGIADTLRTRFRNQTTED